jgi:hypothetical protein
MERARESRPGDKYQSNEVAARYLFDEQHGRGNLFFSSARPGGFGGPDIYESEITDSGFASPVNILELNTASLEACFWVRKGRSGRSSSAQTGRNVTGDLSMYDMWVATRSSVYEKLVATREPWPDYKFSRLSRC